MAKTPVLRLGSNTKMPTNLEQLNDLVAGLNALAQVHDVAPDKVNISVSEYDFGSRHIEANWTTPAIV